jgi:hypothetical protein
MKQLKASMPDQLAERLEAASVRSGRSLSAEICSRIESSLATDQTTQDFLEGVARIAVEIERETGATWSRHAGSHEHFVKAIVSRLAVLKPEGPTAFGDRPHATIPDDSLHLLGAIVEARLRQQPDFTSSSTRKFLEEEYQRLRRLEKLTQYSDTPLPAREAERQQKQKADQQRKRGKKS